VTNSASSFKSGKLIVVSAPSGAGKTTLCTRLLKDVPQLTLSVSSTTRAPRGQERHGVEYFFLSKPEFEKAIADSKFAEHAKVHDHFYGTSREVIEKAWMSGKSVLFVIDVQGAESLKRAYPERTVRIFISPPNLKTLEERLRARGTDDEVTILKRLRNAETEMKQSQHFDHIVVNDDLATAYAQLRAVVAAELGTPT
jgi:guanylate kinase